MFLFAEIMSASALVGFLSNSGVEEFNGGSRGEGGAEE
jgi:hypothetical protein